MKMSESRDVKKEKDLEVEIPNIAHLGLHSPILSYPSKIFKIYNFTIWNIIENRAMSNYLKYYFSFQSTYEIHPLLLLATGQ